MKSKYRKRKRDYETQPAEDDSIDFDATQSQDYADIKPTVFESPRKLEIATKVKERSGEIGGYEAKIKKEMIEEESDDKKARKKRKKDDKAARRCSQRIDDGVDIKSAFAITPRATLLVIAPELENVAVALKAKEATKPSVQDKAAAEGSPSESKVARKRRRKAKKAERQAIQEDRGPEKVSQGLDHQMKSTSKQGVSDFSTNTGTTLNTAIENLASVRQPSQSKSMLPPAKSPEARAREEALLQTVFRGRLTQPAKIGNASSTVKQAAEEQDRKKLNDKPEDATAAKAHIKKLSESNSQSSQAFEDSSTHKIEAGLSISSSSTVEDPFFDDEPSMRKTSRTWGVIAGARFMTPQIRPAVEKTYQKAPEDWERRLGKIHSVIGNKEYEREENVAFSAAHIQSHSIDIKLRNAYSSAGFEICAIPVGVECRFKIEAAEASLMFCSIASGRVEAKLGNVAFSLGEGGMLRVRSGEECLVCNKGSAEAKLHVVSML